LEIPQGAQVLVPAYVCRAAVDPLLAYGANVVFYDLDRDCKPDFSDLERKTGPNTSAVVGVHYFGFPQAIRQLRSFCDMHRLALIEDCAHVLSGEIEGAPIGTFGDAAVFSWRKFLPVHDGAELVINRSHQMKKINWAKESPLFTLKVGVNMLDKYLVESRQAIPKFTYRAVRAAEAAFRICAGRYFHESSMMKASTNGILFDLHSVNWPMSRVSRWTKNHSNIKNIITRRRLNYQILQEELSGLKAVSPLFRELPDGICPWVFPILFRNLTDAHIHLRGRGIPAVTWGGVRHPCIPKGVFRDADFLYDHLVLLPVHQCLSDGDTVGVARAVKALCAR
jgi:dTDP-4-amino-4,6-dideoxygalactose transaminase